MQLVNFENKHDEYAHAFQQGDECALAWFYRAFQPGLSLYAFRWVENRQIAEEIVSEAFIKTWKMHWKLDNYFTIRAYLYKTVQRDSIRARQKEKRRAAIYRESQPGTITSDTPYDHLIRSEVYRLIHTALQDLSPGSKRVLIMHYLEGKTTGEIAAELNLSASTIKTQKSKGLEALRKMLLRTILFQLLLGPEFFLLFQ